MDTNSLATEKVAVVGSVPPQTITAMQFTSPINMAEFLQALGIAELGAVNTGDTMTFAAYACDGSGNNATLITDKEGVQKEVVLPASASNQNSFISIGIRAEDLAGDTYQYLKFGLSCGTTGGPAAVTVLGLEPKYGPASKIATSSDVIQNG